MSDYRWTNSEEARAIDMLKSGFNCSEVAREIGRSADAVCHKNNRKWNIPSAHIENHYWTDEEEQKAVFLLKEGRHHKEVANILGRTISSVSAKNDTKWKIFTTEWSSEDESVMREMWEAGKSEQEISDVLKRSVAAVHVRKSKFKFNRRGMVNPKTNIDFFKNWNEKSAYVYGLIATDGCVSESGPGKKVLIAQSGESGKILLNQIRESTGGGVYRNNGNHKRNIKPYYMLHLNGKELTKTMREHNITPRKSLTLKISDVPDSLWSHYFRGVIDGDGNLYMRSEPKRFYESTTSGRMTISLISCSKDFAEGVRNTIEKLTGIRGRIKIRKYENSKCHDAYTIVWSESDSQKLAAWMYENKENSFWLDRKFAIYQKSQELLSRIFEYQKSRKTA